MEKSTMNLEDTTAAINLVKREYSGVFKMADLISAFKGLKVTLYGQLPYSLKSLGYIVPASVTTHGGYMWAKPEPIHITRVEELFVHARKEMTNWSKRRADERKSNKLGVVPIKNEQVIEGVITPVQEHKDLIPVDKAILNAIKLLSECGYRISKPVIIYEEVTVKLKQHASKVSE